MSARDALAVATAGNLFLAWKEAMARRWGAAPPLFDGVAHLAGSAIGALG
jgi:hypothetical protein